ncbi:ParB N-terminal domain-containing protein [Amycolatopsis vancoresmycina]|uniref:ParB-like N-terminal domain-containing protein n=1 Tax=Amycolatopsis vancoresmycina DSM 44592 TaxID=1292037 RepID=R1GF64_9PSEU|nr:ParB N-terminal domain-containing protein [Amycolatopsis vancoresmycina]EOD69917.1 hypothetical protein H480_03658 [Amycolatopsis vancoresmycina DSM 44592]
MTTIPIKSLHQGNLDTQRSGLDESRIQYFIDHPTEIEGILVYEAPSDGERVTVNGHHRVEAARRLGWTTIEAKLRPGTRTDALTYMDMKRKPWSEIEAENYGQ